MVLHDYERHNTINDRIRYLIVKKVVLKIVKNSIEKILTFHNAIILIKSIVSDNKYDYYYNIFFKKFLYKVKSNIQNFQINVCRL